MILSLRKTGHKYDRIFDCQQERWKIVLNEVNKQRSFYFYANPEGDVLGVDYENFHDFINDCKIFPNAKPSCSLTVCALDSQGQDIQPLPPQIATKLNGYQYEHIPTKDFFPDQNSLELTINYSKLKINP
jgi:hypothetical protein